MKNKKVLIMMFAFAIFTVIAGCDKSSNMNVEIIETVDNDKTSVEKESDAISYGAEIPDEYKDIIDKAYDIVTGNIEEGYAFAPGEVGIMELCGIESEKKQDMLNQIGYAVKDVDNNGAYELIIGVGDNDIEGNSILALYTFVDNEPRLIFEEYVRSRYYMLQDGTFYHEGSGGAAYTLFGTFDLASDGKTLIAKDFYFSDFKGEPQDSDNWGWFHNTTGGSDITQSEWVEFEYERQPYDMMDAYKESAVDLGLTFLCDYDR